MQGPGCRVQGLGVWHLAVRDFAFDLLVEVLTLALELVLLLVERVVLRAWFRAQGLWFRV